MHGEPRKQDIVQRLHDCTCVPHGEICREAGDEIRRLRAVIRAWLQYSARAERDIRELQLERDRLRARLELVESAQREQAAARTTIARIREIDNADALPVGRPWNAMDA